MSNILRKLRRTSSANSITRLNQKTKSELASSSYSENSAAVSAVKMKQQLANWKMPKYKINQIYKTEIISRKTIQIVSENNHFIGQ